jgi:hypothetical protein
MVVRRPRLVKLRKKRSPFLQSVRVVAAILRASVTRSRPAASGSRPGILLALCAARSAIHPVADRTALRGDAPRRGESYSATARDACKTRLRQMARDRPVAPVLRRVLKHVHGQDRD